MLGWQVNCKVTALERKPMIVEMHAHTSEHSTCSHVSAVELVQRALAKELQGIVLTDHHFLWSNAEISELRTRAGLPDYFLIFPAQEVKTSDFGDVLVYAADETIPAGTPLSEIRHRFPDAALVWAHPYRKQKRPGADALLDPLLDAVEIFNANHSVAENTRGLRDWHHLKFTAIGGTDTHALSYTGTYPTIFDHPVQNVRELAEEIRNGRCRPFFKEIPRAGSQIQVTELTIGTKGFDDRREKIIVKSHHHDSKWKSAERSYRIIEQIARNGFSEGRFRVPRPLGSDPESRTLIEEGVRGKSLHDRLVRADAESAKYALRLAAQWLAKLHKCALQVTPPHEFFERETGRVQHYLESFTDIGHPQTRRATEIMDRVLKIENRLYADQEHRLVQGHGDFHLKNIFIGQDNPDDRGTTFVAVIDFDSSYCLPPAFDVGTFLAQYRNQLFHREQVRQKAPEKIFLDTYLAFTGWNNRSFLSEVELFKARTCLSIASYLIKVGMGDSEDLWRVLVDGEQALVNVAMRDAERVQTAKKAERAG